MSPADAPRDHWLDSIRSQNEFCSRALGRSRVDDTADWRWYERTTDHRRKAVRSFIKRLVGISSGPAGSVTLEWLETNAARLWETRLMLADEISRSQFDQMLILRLAGHRRYFFPRQYFSDFARTLEVAPFTSTELPETYLGLPLSVTSLRLQASPVDQFVRIICAAGMVGALNRYRQYFVERAGVRFAPRMDEVVLDCGACIGDVSAIFAALVGPRGKVHAFDPEPLHLRFCALQAALNDGFSERLRLNTLAVTSRSESARTKPATAEQIRPGLRADTASFDSVSIDDYARDAADRIDLIKMDIEGAEMDALRGARDVLSTLAPRLAVSGYHKPSDLWEIPEFIRSTNPRYLLSFGHHSATPWESVFYAAVAD